MADAPGCRFCDAPLEHTFVDLGMSPLCESFLTADQLDAMEPFFPLHAFVCGQCLLVQLREYVAPADIFREYAYFSSYSDTWLAHARDYCDRAAARLGLGTGSLVVELASNDGYLLRNFVERGIPVLGVEPARNVAAVAIDQGVPTLTEFFGAELARDLLVERGPAELVIGNNVLAQVPDLNSFVEGIRILLGERGVVTLEFPHLLRLVEGNQFDTIYHEHFSYFSFLATERIFEAHGLRVFDVEELRTHGGSLRVWGTPAGADAGRFDVEPSDAVAALRAREHEAGYDRLDSYSGFRERVEATKFSLLEFLIEARRRGERVLGYGAPGKANTLLNYCGIRTDLLELTVDRNPYKHGRFTPGTHIPICEPERLDAARPDYVLILAWNLRDEIAAQLAPLREHGTRFVVPIPELAVW